MIGTYHTSLPAYVKARAKVFANQWCSITWSYVKWFYGKCKLVLAPSDSIKSELERYLSVPIGIFSRGVDTDVFAPAYRKRDGSELPHILYVGRLAPEKNIEMLVDAFGEIETDAVLQIVGEGPLYDALRNTGSDRVEVLGLKRGEELSTVYASADVFAYPSRTDTFGNAVLEAMSSGLPAVVMNEGGPKEIVTDKHDGFVVTDRQSMVHRLRQLATDTELRRKMSKNARETAESRSWDKAFGHLFDSYRNVGNIGNGSQTLHA
jgi:glycosyltransferase involved in cell wall biosynthesis